MNSFTASVEKHADASINVIVVVSIAQDFVNVEDTVLKSKKETC